MPKISWINKPISWEVLWSHSAENETLHSTRFFIRCRLQTSIAQTRTLPIVTPNNNTLVENSTYIYTLLWFRKKNVSPKLSSKTQLRMFIRYTYTKSLLNITPSLYILPKNNPYCDTLPLISSSTKTLSTTNQNRASLRRKAPDSSFLGWMTHLGFGLHRESLFYLYTWKINHPPPASPLPDWLAYLLL